MLQRLGTTLVILVLACAPLAVAAATSDAHAAFAVVQQFVDGFNSGGSMKAALATCAPQATIIDEFPPHQWKSCADWANAFAVSSRSAGDTDGKVALGEPWHVDVTENVAYVVVPASFTYKEHGKPTAEHGSIWTVILHKISGSWKITGWTWAKH